MRTKELIKLHERALEVLNEIKNCKYMKQDLIKNADTCAAKFPDLRSEYLVEIKDVEKTIIELENRYFDIAVKIEEVQNGK